MKYFSICICVALQTLIVTCKVIPDYLPQPCSKSNPDYNDCTIKVLNKWLPFLSKGIPEINVPKLSPLHIPLFVANRSLADNVDLSVTLKDARVWGFNSTYIKHFRFNPQKMAFALHLHIPQLKVMAQYAISSQISSFSAEASGFCKGNATDIDLFFKFILKPVERLGVNYYTFKDFDRKSSIDGGYIKMVSKNSDYQFAADVVTNFINENPKRTLFLVNLIFKKNALEFYKTLGERVLASIPADELIPE